MNKFWNWVHNENDTLRTLYLDGAISDESWYDDDITPKLFRDELFSASGEVVIYLNSPGGDCVAASQIYTMLMEYPYSVTVKIDGLAASAASVIAMAGTKVLMSPTAMMMVHNPLTIAIGDTEEMQKAIAMLDEVKESIITAYEIKTGLSRAKISHLMDCETWMNAKKAIELGFADGLLEGLTPEEEAEVSFAFSRRAVTNSLLGKCMKNAPVIKPPLKPVKPADTGTADSDTPDTPPEIPGISAESLEKRLSLLSH